jgi:hypothetical protein
MIFRRAFFAVTAGALAAGNFVIATPAAADGQTYGNITAALGYSSNPFEQIDGSSTAFGRLSAFALHNWKSATGTTAFSGYVENTTYLKDYGSRQIFDLTARTDQQLSTTVSIFGRADFSGDIAGQLSNRLIGVPTEPPVVNPQNPLLAPTDSPDAFGYSGRQYRAVGQLGLTMRPNEKDSWSASASAERVMFTGAERPPSYNVFSGTAQYSHQVSPRTQLGGALYAQRQEFAGSNNATLINPSATIRVLLSETLTVDGGAGVLFIHNESPEGSSSSTAASFSLGLCNATSQGSFCGRIARDARNEPGTTFGNQTGRAAISTNASLTYFRRLNAVSTVQATLSAVQYSAVDAVEDNRVRSTYVSGVVGYDRKLGHRLSTGVSAGLRKLYQPGTDPDYDFNGSIYLSYHWGQI